MRELVTLGNYAGSRTMFIHAGQKTDTTTVRQDRFRLNSIANITLQEPQVCT